MRSCKWTSDKSYTIHEQTCFGRLLGSVQVRERTIWGFLSPLPLLLILRLTGYYVRMQKCSRAPMNVNYENMSGPCWKSVNFFKCTRDISMPFNLSFPEWLISDNVKLPFLRPFKQPHCESPCKSCINREGVTSKYILQTKHKKEVSLKG